MKRRLVEKAPRGEMAGTVSLALPVCQVNYGTCPPAVLHPTRALFAIEYRSVGEFCILTFPWHDPAADTCSGSPLVGKTTSLPLPDSEVGDEGMVYGQWL